MKRPLPRRIRPAAAAALVAVMATAGAAPAQERPAAPGRTAVNIALDLATIVRIPAEATTLVVGNPTIADGTLQRNGILILTGKSYGATNLLALDSRGETIQEMMIQVRPRDQRLLVVQRGMVRETYSCAPRCEKTLMLGDDQEYYTTTNQQIASRNGAASGGGVAPAAQASGPALQPVAAPPAVSGGGVPTR